MRDYIPLLYEDQYVRVTDSSIIINNYYFPFGSKSIAIDQVLSIDTDIELDLLSEQYHAWGFCRSTNIWWAKDGSRIDSRERLVSRPYVIVRLTNSWVSCGFTMSHPQAGLQILRALLADKKPRAPPNFAEYASNNGVMYRPTTQ
ncbi:hypothetical protein EV182_007254 [Spiromyces aspiralis]|uniref:Uncharacterized protein n=1 Tax=Spiromyces aspiralis TaxID=68401 RepID=A0ACC1HSL4_9FUNG|nr:hypothetical protein EV182_007254 [Spiromyces aspiralis]